MTVTLRTTSNSGATTKGSALTHAELDANFLFTQSGGGTIRTIAGIGNEIIRLTDFSGSVETVSAALRSAASTGWLGVSYDDWNPAMVLALARLSAVGGGVLVIPYTTEPRYFSDGFIVPNNVRLVCESELTLANMTSGGGFVRTGSDVILENLMLNGGGLYSGGSGENGVSFVGLNSKMIGGHIRSFKSGNNDDGTGDGGKALQTEYTGTVWEHVVASGVSIKSCFIGIDTVRDYSSPVAGTEFGPLLFTGITAEDCKILMLAKRVTAPFPSNDYTGQEHHIVLNGFVAKNCGTFEGVLQFSSCSNVLVENGLVTNEGFTTPAFIKGRTRYSHFKNIQFAGNCTSIIDLTPGTYCTGTGESIQNDYDIQHIGTVGTLLLSAAGTDTTLQKSNIRARLDTDVSTALIQANASSATTQCNFGLNGQWIKGTASYIQSNLANFAAFEATGDVLQNSESGTFTATVTSSGGTITTVGTTSFKYRKYGDTVTLTYDIAITTNGTGSGYINVDITGGASPLGTRFRPASGAAGLSVSGTEIGVSGLQGLSGSWASSTAFILSNVDGTYPGADGARFVGHTIYTVSA